MTKNSINTKCEALELHELSVEELDAVSGGDKSNAVQNAQRQQENKAQASAMQIFSQMVFERQF